MQKIAEHKGLMDVKVSGARRVRNCSLERRWRKSIRADRNDRSIWSNNSHDITARQIALYRRENWLIDWTSNDSQTRNKVSRLPLYNREIPSFKNNYINGLLTFKMFSTSAEFSVGPGLEFVPWNIDRNLPSIDYFNNFSIQLSMLTPRPLLNRNTLLDNLADHSTPNNIPAGSWSIVSELQVSHRLVNIHFNQVLSKPFRNQYLGNPCISIRID